MSGDLQRWADDAMYAAEPISSTTPKVFLLSATPDPLGALAAASMMYEGKVCRDINSAVNDEMRKYYWEQSLQTHLKAPLEFIDFHFLVEGVTRALTHQMVRQRTAVYAQESQRFAVKEGLADEVAYPPSIRPDSEAALVWDETVEAIDDAYNILINRMMIPAEDARGLLPHSITTRLHYKTNLRNLVEHAGNRLCTQAQFEWRLLWAEIIKAIRGGIGLQYGHPPNPKTHGKTAKRVWTPSRWQFEHIADSNLFRPVCYAQGKCPFNADYDRGCTIRSRVEEGKFDEIDPAEWLADHAAARR